VQEKLTQHETLKGAFGTLKEKMRELIVDGKRVKGEYLLAKIKLKEVVRANPGVVVSYELMTKYHDRGIVLDTRLDDQRLGWIYAVKKEVVNKHVISTIQYIKNTPLFVKNNVHIVNLISTMKYQKSQPSHGNVDFVFESEYYTVFIIDKALFEIGREKIAPMIQLADALALSQHLKVQLEIIQEDTTSLNIEIEKMIAKLVISHESVQETQKVLQDLNATD
jgi:hypothetical protein